MLVLVRFVLGKCQKGLLWRRAIVCMPCFAKALSLPFANDFQHLRQRHLRLLSLRFKRWTPLSQ